MSWQAQAEVWPVEMSPSNKLVALRLAWSADPEGNNIFPSTKTVAAECCIDRRTVRNALRFLEAEGFLVQVKEANPATWRPAEYRMDLQALRLRASHPEGGEGAEPEGLGSKTPGVRVSRPPEKSHQKPQEKERDSSPFPLNAIEHERDTVEPETIANDKPINDREPEPMPLAALFDLPDEPTPPSNLPTTITRPKEAGKLSGADLEAAFGEWWNLYPRKVSRGAALRAFKPALTRASLGELIAGVRRYAEHCQRERTEVRFIAHGASWLNAERWLDQLPDAQTARPQRGGFSLASVAQSALCTPSADPFDFLGESAAELAPPPSAQRGSAIIDTAWEIVN